MTHELAARLSKAIEDHLLLHRSKGEKAFGFYWTRKSAELASRLIEEFSGPSSVVLDPFMGSGSTAIGARTSRKKRLFVGIELNEMPVANLRVTLGAPTVSYEHELERLREVIETISELYTFPLISGHFRITRIIHNIEDAHLTPTAFIGKLAGEKKAIRFNRGELGFDEVFDLYQERTSNFTLERNELLASNSRIAIKPGMHVSDVFGPLAFEAFSTLRARTDQSFLFQLVIGASIHLCRLTDSKSQSQFPYWHPQKDIHEQSVAEVTMKKFIEISKLLNKAGLFEEHEIIEEFSDWSGNKRNATLIVTGDVSAVLGNVLPEETVDLVITDPPYFDQVAYSEYLKLWEFFTGFKSNLENEIVESSRVGAEKTRARFIADLCNAFTEIRRCMKAGAIALVYFKDSKPSNLHDFIFCLERAGLQYVSQVHLPKSTYTYKQNTSQENTVGGDAIMIFVAVDNLALEEPQTTVSMSELDSFFLKLFSEYISSHGPSTLTSALDNLLISQLYPTGYLSQIKSSGHFAQIASKEFDFNPLTRQWSHQK